VSAGSVGILNVGAGDTKLTFDRNNPVERIRAARIVKDMLRRGYALLVDVGDGKYQRVHDFDEERCEYIIADFAPEASNELPAPRVTLREEVEHGKGVEPQEDAAHAPTDGGEGGGPRRRGRPPKRSLPAEQHNAVAVARTAGG
jgi:hypothetical protein